MTESLMEKIVSLAKRRGFVYQGSEIYGGLAGTWDYGPLGVALKKNIENLWWKRFVLDREDMYGIDAALLMNPNVWKASGHVDGFADPLVEDVKTHRRYRADHLLEEAGVDPKGMTAAQMDQTLKEKGIRSPDGNTLGDVKQFNMMFKTSIGASGDESSISYLRPETAQGMFVNFKNVMDTFHPKLPFGMAQIGKAFRNEIAPRDFIFRVRELEQMEIEYFVRPEDWRKHFDYFLNEQKDYLTKDLGLPEQYIHSVEVPAVDRAHYSKHSVDTEFDFPFGQKELLGLAYRTDFDLGAHAKASGVDLSYYDEETKERFTPHCIEPTFGVGRLFLAILSGAYAEDEKNGEVRTFLKFSSNVAPVKAAVFPLLKNKPELVAKAREVYVDLKVQIPQLMWDDNGNIGKRYRRQDEIGTPYCITIDFDTLGESGDEKKDTVTVRERDTGEQTRLPISELAKKVNGS
ncbi:MAG: glycyl-tRNA synthetase [Parcubacteria group bacterium Gr01-1014_8]|nr:MAG: glycyl-tRNA synthetase [Parcubacteria group bacterium Gr01-1014_8]